MLFLGLVAPTVLFSQKRPVGKWEGTLTNGLHSQSGQRFELFLEIKGKVVRGKTFIYNENDEATAMDIEGTLYDDRSIYFEEVRPSAGQSTDPVYTRKYQLLFTRSIWDSTLDGYWQEIHVSPLDQKRKMGKIVMKKAAGSKA